VAFPLLTASAVAGVSTPAVLIGLASVAGFLAHEPLLVRLGRRGARVKRDEGRRATAWLAVAGATTVCAGLAALWLLESDARWSLLLPLGPAALLAAAIAAGQEKSALGEVAAALSFSLLTVPVCLAAGSSTSSALAVGIAFASIFVLGTLVVRAVVLGARGGGNPSAARRTRVVVLMLAAVISVLIAAAGRHTLLPWSTLAAVSPGVLAAVTLSIWWPSPTKLRRVGWLLIAATSAAAVVLTAGLAGT
jgi:hypothetical protein